MMIEGESFEIISASLKNSHPQEHMPVLMRVIHATGDFEFESILRFHQEAITRGIAAIKSGKKIFTDVKMVETGINKPLLERYGCEVFCYISDIDVIEKAKSEGKTRAEVAVEKAARNFGAQIGIVAIGNAPTALLKVIELVDRGVMKPDLIVGVPVGFVSAVESKEMLSNKTYPFITCLGTKGGSTVAVAILNALLRMASDI